MSESTLTFGELIKSGTISLTDGYRAKNSELGGNGLIFLRAGHVTDTHIDFGDVERFYEELTPMLQEKTSRIGDVIVTTKGNSTGRTSFVDATMPTFVYSPHLSRWRVQDKNKVDAAFLRYWCRSPQFVNQMRGLAASTDMAPYFSLRDQQRLEITLPHIGTQRAIGTVLGSLDDKIEQNRRTGRALETLARTTFKAWFVDFKPVKAKATGAAGFPGMPPAAFTALPDRLTDSPLGPVPEGWAVRPLSAVCQIVSGGTPKRSMAEFWDGDVPWYSLKDAPPDGMPWVASTDEQITKAGLGASAATLVPVGCTIISARGTVGRLALVARPMAFNQSCYGLLPIEGASYRHLYLLLRQVVAELQQRTHGSVFDTITRQTFDGVSVVRPDSALLQQFERAVAPSFDLLLSLLKESSKLAELRNYLLPRLLSGRVRVEVLHG